MRQGQRSAMAVAALALLSGCLGSGMGGALAPDDADMAAAVAADVARAPGFDEQTLAAEGAAPVALALDARMNDGSRSPLIEGLLARRSVLQPGPLARVADAALAASTRVAEADLRAAMLREEARSSNWLPRLGPQVSVTSLGSLVTSLVLNQAIVDHGARAAERDHAKADVEVAAVRLAQDANLRVAEALDLYLTAQAATARAAVIEGVLPDVERYVYIMTERVMAGINDRGDLQVVQAAQDRLLSDLATDREVAATAMAELQAMAEGDLTGLAGLSPIADAGQVPALSVLLADAEGRRAMAAARVTRAGYLPGLGIGGDLADGGLAANIGSAQGLGLGQGAAIDAAMAEGAAAEARVGQEEEEAARTVAALTGQRDGLIRRQGELEALALQALENRELFVAQQRAGQRSVPETMSVIEGFVRAERAAVEMPFEVARLNVRIAARLGALVDGERM
jgi:outer membrane protein, adhesin transport system